MADQQTPDCPKCEAARQRARAEGHRNWRTAYACYDHAAVSLDDALRPRGIDPGDDSEPEDADNG